MLRRITPPLRLTLALLVAAVGLRAATASAAPPAGWERPVRAKQQQRALRSVIKQVYKAAQRGEKPIVMVDIDDTAVDGRVRLRIAAARSGLPAHAASAQALYAGLEGDALAAKKTAFNAQYFDDPSLASHDVAQAGAAAFLRMVVQAGGRVVYATGRWESTRGATTKLLDDLGLPLARPEDLLLNPSEKVRAADWKTMLPAIVKKLGRTIAYFDNEPGAVEGYRPAFPGARAFRLATFRFQEAARDKPADVMVLRDFTTTR